MTHTIQVSNGSNAGGNDKVLCIARSHISYACLGGDDNIDFVKNRL